jgi:MtN3 and saliva related transmembrane protein
LFGVRNEPHPAIRSNAPHQRAHRRPGLRLTTAAYVPQLIRVIRLHSARDISLPTFLMFALGVFFWLLYGLYTGSMPIIVCNAANLFLSMSIVLLKLRFDRHPTGELHP